MYYLLNHGYELCGYKGLPFLVRMPDNAMPMAFTKEQYEAVLMADGHTEIDPSALTETQKRVFEKLMARGAIRAIDAPSALEKEQNYRYFPVVAKKSIQWSITGACNYRCKHCFMSAPECRFAEPTWAQCESAIHQMEACGIREITLTGGEPLISPHFYKILDECKHCGIRVTRIYSNGAMVNAALLDALDARGMRPAFQMSFDGIGWHDWMRGIPGAEKAVLEAFRLCHERGFNTTAAMALHKHNLSACNESLRLLDSLGVSFAQVDVPAQTGLWARQTEHFLNQEEAFEAYLTTIIPRYMADDLCLSVQFAKCWGWDTRTRKGQILLPMYGGKPESTNEWACSLVRYNGYLSPEGYLLPCMPMVGTAIQSRFESIYDKPMLEILANSAYTGACLTKMGDVIDAHDECKACEYRLLCGAGCRACAIGETGTDYRAIERDTCHLFKAGWYERILELHKSYD